jgi:hypothetical protein
LQQPQQRQPTICNTRRQLLASWNAVKNPVNGVAIVLNHASAAGWLLEQHCVASLAVALCPVEPWWTTVRNYLLEVVKEESASEE